MFPDLFLGCWLFRSATFMQDSRKLCFERHLVAMTASPPPPSAYAQRDHPVKLPSHTPHPILLAILQAVTRTGPNALNHAVISTRRAA